LPQAFSSLGDDVVDQLTEDPDTAQLVIQHHIIRGQSVQGIHLGLGLHYNIAYTRRNRARGEGHRPPHFFDGGRPFK